jgi:Alpha/beta hydrolase
LITYAQLWSAEPSAWRTAGAAWQGVTGLVDRRAAEVAQSGAALRQIWSGAASRRARRSLDDLRAALVASRTAFVEIDQVLAEHAAAVAAAKAMLVASVSAAPAGVAVGPDGSVSLDRAGPDRPDLPLAGRRASEVAAGIRDALARATAADQDATARLAGLAAAAGTGWETEPPAWRPAAGAEPAAVRRWWDGLDPAEQRWLVQHEPDVVGRLDGVPASARDQANRVLLEDHRSHLLSRRARLLALRMRTPEVGREIAGIDRSLDGLDAIRHRLAATVGPRAYLLALDPADDGRAVVSVGNPDRADNVLTYVPGMTSNLPGVAEELDRAYAMAARCATLGQAETTASVLWLDYDAPDFIHEAARAEQAGAAGPALHRFQEGLRATHIGPAAQQTVLGHSYGSLVVGMTARDHGLAADSLVFLGSPGVGVDHAGALRLPADRIWSSTAYNDLIQYAAPAPRAALERLALAARLPGAGLVLLTGVPSDDLWFGRNPSDPDFGGRTFGSASRGHTGYWDPGNPALDGMARITLGGRA